MAMPGMTMMPTAPTLPGPMAAPGMAPGVTAASPPGGAGAQGSGFRVYKVEGLGFRV